MICFTCSEAGMLHTKRSAEVISVIPQDMISLDSHDEVFSINHRHGALNRELAERAKSGWEHVDASKCRAANQNKSLRTAQAWLAHMAARLGLPVVDTVWQSTGQTSDAPAFTVSPDGGKSPLIGSLHCQKAAQLRGHRRDTDTNSPVCVPDEPAGQTRTVKIFVVYSDNNTSRLLSRISPCELISKTPCLNLTLFTKETYY